MPSTRLCYRTPQYILGARRRAFSPFAFSCLCAFVCMCTSGCVCVSLSCCLLVFSLVFRWLVAWIWPCSFVVVCQDRCIRPPLPTAYHMAHNEFTMPVPVYRTTAPYCIPHEAHDFANKRGNAYLTSGVSAQLLPSPTLYQNLFTSNFKKSIHCSHSQSMCTRKGHRRSLQTKSWGGSRSEHVAKSSDAQCRSQCRCCAIRSSQVETPWNDFLSRCACKPEPPDRFVYGRPLVMH